MKCIFCGKEKKDTEFSIEHVVPDALGGTLTLPNVCKDCNSYLGARVDCNLTNNFLVELARYQYKIPNRQGDIVNPLKKLLSSTNERVDFCINKKTGEAQSPYIFPTKPQIEDCDGEKKISVKLDSRDKDIAPKIIKKFCRRRNLRIPTDNEIDTMMKSGVLHKSKPELTGKREINIVDIERAMLKIVYELSYYWLGEEYLKDETAIKIKEYILTGKAENNICGSTFFGIHASEKFKYRDGTHFAYMVLDRNNIYILVRIFDCIETTVLITNCADKYQFNQENMPYIILDAINKKKEEGALIEKIIVDN